MNSGQLRHFVTIEQPIITQDDYGAAVTTWTTYATVRCKIETVSSTEFEYAKSFGSTTTKKITTRYIRGVLTTFRVNYGGRIFVITGLDNKDELGRELVIYATENNNGNQ